MTRKSAIVVSIIILCCASLCAHRAYGAADWSFAVLGDTRGHEDSNTGVSEYLNAIATVLANPASVAPGAIKPSAVFVTGDLINGGALDTPIDYTTQFNTWNTSMAPVIATAGIPVYTVRGNHEACLKDGEAPALDLKAAYYTAFGSTTPTIGSLVPQNGPNNGGTDNQTGFTWNLKKNNVRVIALDQYFYWNATPQGGSYYYKIDQAWLDKQLTKTAPKRYTFVTAHEPAYYLKDGFDFYGSTSTAGAAAQKTFWDSLGSNGVQMYVCCHVHNVQIATANDSNGHTIYQSVIGNGGAKLDEVGTWDSALSMKYQNFANYGFALFTVTDATITITYYLYDPATPSWSVPVYTTTLTANPVYAWNTAAGTFSTAGSWDPATVPGTTDTAVFDRGAGTTSTVTFTADATNNRLFIANGSNTFNLDGNKYTATTTNIDGSEYATYDPKLTISGAGSTFNTTTMTMDGNSSFIVDSGASATCGTITIEGGTPTMSGTINFTTLDLETNNLTVTGAYNQPATSTLKLTANSSSSYGSITSGASTSIAAGSAINVTVGGYIPNNALLTIVNTGGTGIGNIPGTVTSTNQYTSFTAVNSGNNLALRAKHSFSGASNPNAATVSAVLDNITNPSADMTTVLDALNDSSPGQVGSSLNTMHPTIDGALLQAATSMVNQFNSALTTHLGNTQSGAATGVSTGSDRTVDPDIWAQSLGDYSHQDPRDASNGYNAASWGVTGGADMTYRNDSLHMGIASGYGQTFVRSKDSSGRTDIDSIPFTLYFDYANTGHPFYLDAAFTFIYNLYKASRVIAINTLAQRTADADYKGQQYSTYLEGGYSFFCKNLRITPLVSANYMHLHTGKYTESGADALNLSVGSQDYDMCITGIGAKIAYPLELKYCGIMPDFHAKWLYDWIGDSQSTTSSFAGGGTSFGTNCFKPARSGYDLGVKLSLKTKYNISLDLDYDFLLKEDYYEHYGSVKIRYSF